MSATTPTEATPETPLERAVRETVAAAPPLSDDAREQLAHMLLDAS